MVFDLSPFDVAPDIVKDICNRVQRLLWCSRLNLMARLYVTRD